MMRTYKSSSDMPIETAQLDEVQIERLDLGQHAVERGPIQNTSQQRVSTLQLGHHRLKRRQGGRAQVAGDPNRVQTRSLVHLSNGQETNGESASPGSSERSVSSSASSGSGDGGLRSQFDGSPRDFKLRWLLSSADHLPSDSAVRDRTRIESARGGRVVVHV